MATRKDYLPELLALPFEERQRYARELVRSLDETGGVDDAWRRELEQRCDADDAGDLEYDEWSLVRDRLLADRSA